MRRIGTEVSGVGLTTKRGVRWEIFIPAASFVFVVMGLVAAGGDVYVKAVKSSFAAIITQVGWMFGPATILFVGILFYCMFSRVGNVKIGGENAEKLLNPASFFGIVITGLTGTGLIFYGAVEPVYHFMNPPSHVGVTAGTPEAAVYSMGQTYMHWTFNVFAIYALLSLTAALVIYNLKYTFSVSSLLRPIFGKYVDGIGGLIIDLLLIFAMVLGNVYSLGQVLISVGSGNEYVFGLTKNGMQYFLISGGLITVSLLCLKSGIAKAVKSVANFNMYIFYGMLAFFIVLGPFALMFGLASEGFAYYLDNLFSLSFVNGVASGERWPSIWTIAFYGSWAGVGPIVALFLGKIGRGYTIRQYLYCIFLGGIAFYMFWFAVFGGSGIQAEMNFGDIYSTVKEKGFERGIYILFSHYPLGMLMSTVYIFVSLLSFVTTMTAKIDAMSGMCMRGINADNLETPFLMKLWWGIYAAFMGWACATFLGFDGVRMFAGFAGVAGMGITVLTAFSLMWMLQHVQHREDGTSILDETTFKDSFISKIGKREQ